MTRLLTWSIVVYRVALRLYPEPFRREFGAELIRDMELAALECGAGGWRGVIGLWRRTLADLMVSAVSQWARARWRLSTWLIGAASGATVAVAWYVHRAAWHLRRDDELSVLLVAVSAVLLVVVSTLTFTTWIVRPNPPRRRRA